MDFTSGKLYTRKQIHASVRGGLQDYLPMHQRHVVAGCFRLDKNPKAPTVILAGKGDRIEFAARTLAKQTDAIPVFIKQATNQWRFEGYYLCERVSTNPDEIERERSQAGRSDIITHVIHLKHHSS